MQGAFTPSDVRIAWAGRIVAAFNESAAMVREVRYLCDSVSLLQGSGAFSLDGAMIDMPTVLQAHNVLRLAVAAKKMPADALPKLNIAA